MLEHTAQAIRAIYEVRIALESFAARLAAERATDAELNAIEGVYGSDYLPDLINLPRDKVVDLNERFHDEIVAACGNDMMREAIRRQARHYFSYRVAQLYSVEELSAAGRDHQRLIDALRAHDKDAAERLAREHLQVAMRITLERFW